MEPNAGQLAPLTGLRGVAAGSVLIAHALDVAFSYSGRHYWEPSSSRLSYFGMSLFFVLSGFVISYNYTPLFQKERPGVALWRFFVARFARLYPLYALSIVVYGHIPSEDSLTLISYLTLTRRSSQNTINPVMSHTREKNARRIRSQIIDTGTHAPWI